MLRRLGSPAGPSTRPWSQRRFAASIVPVNVFGVPFARDVAAALTTSAAAAAAATARGSNAVPQREDADGDGDALLLHVWASAHELTALSSGSNGGSTKLPRMRVLSHRALLGGGLDPVPALTPPTPVVLHLVEQCHRRQQSPSSGSAASSRLVAARRCAWSRAALRGMPIDLMGMRITWPGLDRRLQVAMHRHGLTNPLWFSLDQLAAIAEAEQAIELMEEAATLAAGSVAPLVQLTLPRSTADSSHVVPSLAAPCARRPPAERPASVGLFNAAQTQNPGDLWRLAVENRSLLRGEPPAFTTSRRAALAVPTTCAFPQLARHLSPPSAGDSGSKCTKPHLLVTAPVPRRSGGMTVTGEHREDASAGRCSAGHLSVLPEEVAVIAVQLEALWRQQQRLREAASPGASSVLPADDANFSAKHVIAELPGTSASDVFHRFLLAPLTLLGRSVLKQPHASGSDMVVRRTDEVAQHQQQQDLPDFLAMRRALAVLQVPLDAKGQIIIPQQLREAVATLTLSMPLPCSGAKSATGVHAVVAPAGGDCGTCESVCHLVAALFAALPPDCSAACGSNYWLTMQELCHATPEGEAAMRRGVSAGPTSQRRATLADRVRRNTRQLFVQPGSTSAGCALEDDAIIAALRHCLLRRRVPPAASAAPPIHLRVRAAAVLRHYASPSVVAALERDPAAVFTAMPAPRFVCGTPVSDRDLGLQMQLWLRAHGADALVSYNSNTWVSASEAAFLADDSFAIEAAFGRHGVEGPPSLLEGTPARVVTRTPNKADRWASKNGAAATVPPSAPAAVETHLYLPLAAVPCETTRRRIAAACDAACNDQIVLPTCVGRRHLSTALRAALRFHRRALMACNVTVGTELPAAYASPALIGRLGARVVPAQLHRGVSVARFGAAATPLVLFNAAQTTTPQLIEFAAQYVPIDALTQRPYLGTKAATLTRVAWTSGLQSRVWVPLLMLRAAGIHGRSRCNGLPAASAPQSPAGGVLVRNRRGSALPGYALINADATADPEGVRRMSEYAPCNRAGRRFCTRTPWACMMKVVAHRRGYTSRTWVSAGAVRAMGLSIRDDPRPSPLRPCAEHVAGGGNNNNNNEDDGHERHRAAIAASRRFVHVRGHRTKFINTEEVIDPIGLLRPPMAARVRTAGGLFKKGTASVFHAPTRPAISAHEG